MHRVLIVEDNELNRDMLARRLLRHGFEVVTALDGNEGIRRARLEIPDLILMDMTLPAMSGCDAARSIKGDPRTRGIPIIALTAHAQEEDRNRALEAGCDEYDTKPVELPRLLEKIERLLAKKITVE